MPEQQLRKAFALMKEGEKKQAMMIVRAVLNQDRENVDAWWLMANLLENQDKILRCLNHVLELDPDHRGARKKLAALRPDLANELGPMGEKKKIDARDWSKLDAPKQQSQSSKFNLSWLLGTIITIMIAILGPTIFSLISNNLPVNVAGPPPEEVVIIQFTAAFNGDLETMREYTCDSLEDEWESIINTMQSEIRSNGVNPDDVTFDFSDLQVAVNSRQGRQIWMNISGEMVMTVNGRRVSVDILELTGLNQARVNVVVSDGHWVVCST